ncbi:hypothetical protein AST00_00180 [Staphylococcus equorum]|nr:hypothetical protein AST02_02895 [Staphylococcus equorum]OEK71826.1 hypothetical protein AST01_01000 [Staphylococcus equorum]OEK72360.1 hypothetical protein AST00_00180 [Staphylococcus equorum]
MKNKYFFNISGYIYPFVMVIFMLYLSLITNYTFQFSVQLKTLDNIEAYYEKQINLFIKKEDIFEK